MDAGFVGASAKFVEFIISIRSQLRIFAETCARETTFCFRVLKERKLVSDRCSEIRARQPSSNFWYVMQSVAHRSRRRLRSCVLAFSCRQATARTGAQTMSSLSLMPFKFATWFNATNITGKYTEASRNVSPLQLHESKKTLLTSNNYFL